MEIPLTFRFQGKRVLIPNDFPHPGGIELLKEYEGKDITKFFNSDEKHDILRDHVHSKSALALLSSFIAEEPSHGQCSPFSDEPLKNGRQFCVDESKPIAWQVAKLGENYISWVQQPVSIVPRFFNASWAENCTKVEWWLVPTIWIPVLLWSTVQILKHNELTPSQAIFYFIIGLLSWQALEYSLHRFLFHLRPKKSISIFLHFLIHGCHHKYPLDSKRLVFPPVPASSIVYLVYKCLHSITIPSIAFAIFSGMLCGYISYDCIHYFIHTGVIGGCLKASHMHHHFFDDTKGFGISTPLFDFIFRTTNCRINCNI